MLPVSQLNHGRKLTPDGWKYTRNTQRTHEVKENVAPLSTQRRLAHLQDGLWVRLSVEGKFESDQFAFNSSAAKNVNSGALDACNGLPSGAEPVVQQEEPANCP